jgi:cell division protein ZapE
MQNLPVYHAPLGPRATAALDDAFGKLTDGAQTAAMSLHFKGRSLPVSLAARGVARFGFEELCTKPLGAGDYLAIAAQFHTVILAGVPILGPENRNEARRFMTLIDALYEHRVNLVISADAPPERLYPRGDGAFEFERTVSRLQEMRSSDYIALEHLT